MHVFLMQVLNFQILNPVSMNLVNSLPKSIQGKRCIVVLFVFSIKILTLGVDLD